MVDTIPPWQAPPLPPVPQPPAIQPAGFSGEEFTVRRARAGDAAACAAIFSRWAQATDWYPRSLTHVQVEARVRRVFHQREIWVAEAPATEAPLGYISVDPETRDIGGLYCIPAGKGIGSALLARVQARHDTLTASPPLRNIAAQVFFRRKGFVPVGEHLRCGFNDLPELRLEWWRPA
ncbi:GNAT family N-acetyltransferase [Sagittula salina]|uniref:GNAT family N-acetyltransferase n=1 Tax=Sagittula salina TaxID=2820268 RepID=A0A940MRZ2_9RHOB|nr:GNAT family N-acetyltransferase [Sagittula salina]MBP0483922.1 GNAT family N-acetyltransferase [Sagittula salina]